MIVEQNEPKERNYLAKEKTIFACKDCGTEYSKWQGKCFACGEWNTIVEETKMTGNFKNFYVIAQSYTIKFIRQYRYARFLQ